MGKSRVFHNFRLEQDITSQEANDILNYLRHPEMRAIKPPRPFKYLYSALVEISKGCYAEDGLADPEPSDIGFSFESRTGFGSQRIAALTKPVDPSGPTDRITHKQDPAPDMPDDDDDEEWE